ncbi:MAG: hypothetical protein IID63_06555 [candidate division Zixibacteria bacterium]|nr:hypothetical protein [candidate division Zixibacteria bacterium]
MNPNDSIRKQILEYFYERNRNATSARGKKGSGVKIRDVKRELKELHCLTQQEVMSNLTYLLDNGWINEDPVEKTFKVKGGTVPQVTMYYRISAKGIDKAEGGSQFEPKVRYPNININAIGNKNIITTGDGNVINTEYADLHSSLDNLKDAMSKSAQLREDEKLNYAADIESIKDQLAKPEPNKNIIYSLWRGLEKIATLSSVANAYNQVATLMQSLTAYLVSP